MRMIRVARFRVREGGHMDIIFFYGQVDDIRPEEILQTHCPVGR
jgi:hypothetical protein